MVAFFQFLAEFNHTFAMTIFETVILPVIVSIPAGISTGVMSSYWVSRYFEFKSTTARASYFLRKFPEEANVCVDELRMCQHQLQSQGFKSAWNSLEQLIVWAESENSRLPISLQKKQNFYMPLLESLRPSFFECLPFRKRDKKSNY